MHRKKFSYMKAALLQTKFDRVAFLYAQKGPEKRE